MVPREKRLHEVFEHLRKFFGIHTQTDFAVALKYSRVYISSALNGNEKNLTDKLFENICEAFPGVFNLNYLLTGEGSLLGTSEEGIADKKETAHTSSSDEMTANILEMYARMIRGVDDLRIQLKEELSEVQTVKSELRQARDDFRDATQRLQQAIELLKNNKSGNAMSIGIVADEGDN